jgi:MFS family permease
MKLTYRTTMLACYNGYITQAICINLAPLLFLIFQRNYGLSLLQISLLITFNFSAQLISDFCASVFSDHMDLRRFTVLSHVLAVLVLFGLALLPEMMDPFLGLSLSTVFLGVGGGMTEVMISPIMEACPTDEKSGNMSFLHSFYCWGHVLVIIGSTLFFTFVGIDNWVWLAMIWAVVPILNAFYFMLVPIKSMDEEIRDSGATSAKGGFLKTGIFWLFMLLMLCAGASELAMSQWASAFAETGLGVSKAVGDLAGPCMFAILMGIARVLYAKLSERLGATRYMGACCLMCIGGYLLAAFAPHPVFGLVGCGLCGYAVGAMWPGTYSMASEMCRGGTALFALLALAGDTGCSAGPSLVGVVADISGGNLKAGMLAVAIFPLILFVGMLVLNRKKKKQ